MRAALCAVRTCVSPSAGKAGDQFCRKDEALRPLRCRETLARSPDGWILGLLTLLPACRGTVPTPWLWASSPGSPDETPLPSVLPRASSAPAAGTPSSRSVPLRPQGARDTHGGSPQAGHSPRAQDLGPHALALWPTRLLFRNSGPSCSSHPQPFRSHEPSGRHR